MKGDFGFNSLIVANEKANLRRFFCGRNSEDGKEFDYRENAKISLKWLKANKEKATLYF